MKLTPTFFVAVAASCLALAACATTANAQMRITEYMYTGASGEFIEFTNIGTATIDMTGWSFSDSATPAGTVSLSAFGSVLAGQSVILTEVADTAFRTSWSLPSSVKVIGNNTTNLGRADEINIYNASSLLIDRLTYGDQAFPGTIRTQNVSGRTTLANLGTNNIAGWTLSTAGDPDGSGASTGADIASPGRSGVVAVAVPEVGTFALLAAALLPVGVMVPRKRATK